MGTDPFEKIRGGLFGIGLYEQIREGYGFIVNKSEPGDRVIVTGFSRGAFSARCLASLVATCGVLKERTLDFFDVRDRRAIDDLWDLYKARAEAPGPLQECVQRQCHPRDPKTLSAVGV